MPLKRGVTDVEVVARAQVAAARHNGWTSDEDQDMEDYVYEYILSTVEAHERVLRKYIQECETAESLGQPMPTYNEVKLKFLGPNTTLPTKLHLKKFCRFYIKSCRQPPTVKTCKDFMEKFFMGFINTTGTAMLSNYRVDIYRWISQRLTQEKLIKHQYRKKYLLNKDESERLRDAVWLHDDNIYIPEAYRIQFTWAFRFYCFTGARVGELFTGGLRWRDVSIVLRRREPGGFYAFYKLDRRFFKYNRHPEDIYRSVTQKENENLMDNDTALLLLMGIAQGVFYGVDSLRDLWSIQVPEELPELELLVKEEAEKKFVLRKCTLARGMTEEKMSKTAFTSIMKHGLARAGLPSNASVHQIRRAVGKKIDEQYTEAERSQHLGHRDKEIFGTSYVADCSTVDGDSAYLGRPRDDTIAEYFQGLGQFRQPGLPTSLPFAAQEALKQTAEYQQQDKICLERAAKGVRPEVLQQARQSRAQVLERLKRKALKDFQSEWTTEQKKKRIISRGKEGYGSPAADLMGFMCLLIPQRGRIAATLVSGERGYAQDFPLQMDDLLALYKLEHIIFLPGNEPKDGHCPSSACRVDLSTLAKNGRNRHIMECRKIEMAFHHNYRTADIHYCYLCYTWQLGEEAWAKHCESHLTSLASKLCGSVTYCHTVVRNAFCPFCLGDPNLPATARLVTFTRDSNLWVYLIEFHLKNTVLPLPCPHPLCTTTLANLTSLEAHFIDEHHTGRQIRRNKQSLESYVGRLRQTKKDTPLSAQVTWAPHKRQLPLPSFDTIDGPRSCAGNSLALEDQFERVCANNEAEDYHNLSREATLEPCQHRQNDRHVDGIPEPTMLSLDVTAKDEDALFDAFISIPTTPDSFADTLVEPDEVLLQERVTPSEDNTLSMAHSAQFCDASEEEQELVSDMLNERIVPGECDNATHDNVTICPRGEAISTTEVVHYPITDVVHQRQTRITQKRRESASRINCKEVDRCATEMLLTSRITKTRETKRKTTKTKKRIEVLQSKDRIKLRLQLLPKQRRDKQQLGRRGQGRSKF